MIIQVLNHITSADGATYKPAVERQTSPALAANHADTVSISEAGKALAANEESKATFSSGNRWNSLAEAAHNMSEADADQMVSGMSYASDGVLVSLEDYPSLRLSSTGQVVTKEDMAYFDGMMESVKQGRINLYESEKAKGTHAAEIMDKIVAYMDSLPMKYQILAGVKVGVL